ncbi:LTA synthase family protein [Priestia megaterium]|uniref:LTA synthase family protein n=1 Tax=Priestia megaterium TaxID=1404 RepID=UPI001C8CFF4E|nr:LTA synthase family protein [Priestia megaterium]
MNQKRSGIYFFLFTIIFLIKAFILRYVVMKGFENGSVVILEMSYVIALFLLIELVVKKGKLLVYLVIDIICSLLFFSIAIYSSYFGTVPSYLDLANLNQIGTLGESISILISPKYFIFFLDFVLLIPIIIFVKIKKLELFLLKVKHIGWGVLLFIFLAILLFFVSKGDRLIDPLSTAAEKGILNYELIQIYHDYVETADADANVTNKRIMEVKNAKKIGDGDAFFGVAKQKNVIVIQMESLQNMIINQKIDGQEITPNLNKLIKESYYFPRVYQQIGAGNTSDAEFQMNTSLYPAGNQAISKMYANRKFPSLPRLLQDNQYKTMTFHADDVTYWNRIQLYPALGFEKYYDKSYFKDRDKIGAYGASDEVLYEDSLKVLEGMHKKNQKFYAHIISLSSHTPFELPERKISLKLPQKYDNTVFGHYLEAQHYADKALGEFIENLKKKGIWNDSVVVVYGDHSGLNGGLIQEKDNALIGEMLGHGYTLADRFNIPFIISVPGQKAEVKTNLGGQVDMMPTLTNLLGIPLDKQIHFGQDLFNYENNLIGMRYYMTAGSFLHNQTMYLAGKTEDDESKSFDMKQHKYVDVTEKDNKNYERMLNLYELNDAYLKGLPVRKTTESQN